MTCVRRHAACPFGEPLRFCAVSGHPAGWRRSGLGLRLGRDSDDPPAPIRYQRLHRTASAVLERGRFNAPAAVMVVHSFSQEKRWYEDYEAFCELLGVTASPDCLARHDLPDGYPLYLGWATGAAEHLEA